MVAKGLSRLPASTGTIYFLHQAGLRLRFQTAHCAEGIYFRLGLPFFLHSHSGSPRLRAKGREGERQRGKRGFVITKPASAAAIKGTSSSFQKRRLPFSFLFSGKVGEGELIGEGGARGRTFEAHKRGGGARESDRKERRGWVGPASGQGEGEEFEIKRSRINSRSFKVSNFSS